ncbi:Spinocerebellar ataxia type 10 protein domain [Trypanosoma vivax]|uniref:Ataxin-10 domain-containing protein n=1 Tax=Trypanosoma vivax (strain Y486) TaxID=1055687 RepID=G0U151_TRYVY|nr:hypothetical protein TRVL_05140 [Trypanosoma vivax]KAH8607869.1 Spinocerebellar ataxia type 10 protein domain [Trypanosoma vivax]CCC49806.1 conserved hypothetical protein [Trypanosoma vivax Y486]
MIGREGSVKDLKPDTQLSISRSVDALLLLCETDDKLRDYSLKFMYAHAVDKAAFDAKREEGEEMLHLQRVLQRMVDLALAVASHVLRRTQEHIRDRASSTRTSEESRAPIGLSDGTCGRLQRRSSVVEFSDGSEAWLETGAHLSQQAVELLHLILGCHPSLLKTLQLHLVEVGVLSYLEEALSISREHEIAYFCQGYRTSHFRVLANLTYECKEVCSAIADNATLLSALLSATRIDDENPCMVEWAKFSIRNLCCCSNGAREKLRGLTCQGVADETRELFSGKLNLYLNSAGQVVSRRSSTPSSRPVSPPCTSESQASPL